MTQRPVIWISRRRLVVCVAGAIALLAALIVIGGPKGEGDASILDPAKRVAKGLATQDIYLRPDDYKSDLTWGAYQQVLAAAPQFREQNAEMPFRLALSKYGAMLLLDQGLFGDGMTALVQTFVQQGDGTTTLVEFQLQMLLDAGRWKVNSVTTLVKGTVSRP